jgi:hypothetical protein
VVCVPSGGAFWRKTNAMIIVLAGEKATVAKRRPEGGSFSHWTRIFGTVRSQKSGLRLIRPPLRAAVPIVETEGHEQHGSSGPHAERVSGPDELRRHRRCRRAVWSTSRAAARRSARPWRAAGRCSSPPTASTAAAQFNQAVSRPYRRREERPRGRSSLAVRFKLSKYLLAARPSTRRSTPTDVSTDSPASPASSALLKTLLKPAAPRSSPRC